MLLQSNTTEGRLSGPAPTVMPLSVRQRKQWVGSLRRIGDERFAVTVARTYEASRYMLAQQRNLRRVLWRRLRQAHLRYCC